MAIDPQAQRFLDQVAQAPPLDTQSVERNRAEMRAAVASLGGPAAQVAAVDDVTVPGPHGDVPVRAYRPSAAAELPAVIYLHGGGWTLGEADSFDATVRDLARFSGAVVLNVDYRRAPEHRFPVAADDALAVAEAVLRGEVVGVDRTRLAVAGESAGGTPRRCCPGLTAWCTRSSVWPVSSPRLSPPANWPGNGYAQRCSPTTRRDRRRLRLWGPAKFARAHPSTPVVGTARICSTTYLLRHPLVGELTVIQQSLHVARAPEQSVVVVTTEAGSSSADSITLLRSQTTDFDPQSTSTE